MTRIAVLDDWQGIAEASADWSALQARAEGVFFTTAFADADALVAARAARGMLVSFTPATRSSHATAELALGLILGAARHLALGDAEIRAGRFQDRVPPGMDLEGRTLGVIGLGKIGGRLAGYAQAL